MKSDRPTNVEIHFQQLRFLDLTKKKRTACKNRKRELETNVK